MCISTHLPARSLLPAVGCLLLAALAMSVTVPSI
jgi:hypothetical protein